MGQRKNEKEGVGSLVGGHQSLHASRQLKRGRDIVDSRRGKEEGS